MTTDLTIQEVAISLLKEGLYNQDEILEIFGFTPGEENNTTAFESNNNNADNSKVDVQINFTFTLDSLQARLLKFHEALEEKKQLELTPKESTSTKALKLQPKEEETIQKILKIYKHIIDNPTLKDNFKTAKISNDMALEKYIYFSCEYYVKNFEALRHMSDTFKTLLYLENDIFNQIYGEFKTDDKEKSPFSKKMMTKMLEVLNKQPELSKKLLGPEENEEMLQGRLASLVIQYLTPQKQEEWIQKNLEFNLLQEVEQEIQKSIQLHRIQHC